MGEREFSGEQRGEPGVRRRGARASRAAPPAQGTGDR